MAADVDTARHPAGEAQRVAAPPDSGARPAGGRARWRAMRRLLEDAFPVDAGPHRADTTIAVTIAVAGAVVQVLRLPHGFALNSLWAEDGAVFLHQALFLGSVRAITTPYAGYMHLAPRLVAAVAAAAPPGRAALVFGGTAAALVGVCAAVVFLAARGHLPGRGARLALAAAVVVLPVAGFEMLDNMANIQWYLLVAAFWLLLWRPDRSVWRVVSLVVCFLAAASAPLAGLLLPVAVWRLLATRRPVDHAPTAGLVAGLLLQGWVVVHTAHPASPARPTAADLLVTYPVRGPLTAIFGTTLTRRVFGELGWPVAIAAVVAVALVAMVALLRPRRLSPVVTMLVLGTHLALFFVPFTLRWMVLDRPSTAHPEALALDGRYEAVPLLLLWSLVALAVERLPSSPRWRGGWRVGAVAMLLVLGTVDFRSDGMRASGPTWSTELGHARAACAAATPTEAVDVPISPESWATALPCRWLRR